MNFNERLINSILDTVEETGQYNGEKPEYKHAILPENIESVFKSNGDDLYEFLDSLQEDYWIDFFSIKRNTGAEKIYLRHMTSVKNITSIQQKGLILPDKNIIGNLGHAIYAIREGNIFDDGYDNLREWLSNYYYEEIENETPVEVAEVIIEYSGDYLECIYGNDTVGFLTIKENIPPSKLSIKKINLYDFI